jgi:flagellar basal-body rod protein FlgC
MIQTLTGIESSASALSAERVRMEVITQNIANVHTTRGVDGLPYQRQQVIFQSVLNHAQAIGGGPNKVEVTRIEKDQRPPRLVFQPNHPDANADGMVAYPDISIHQEMADYIVSSRAYEANLAVVKNARTMAFQTLAIGKR